MKETIQLGGGWHVDKFDGDEKWYLRKDRQPLRDATSFLSVREARGFLKTRSEWRSRLGLAPVLDERG